MANAKQKYELQDANGNVIPVSEIASGTFVMNEASVDTSPIDPKANAATQQTAIDAASTIGAGNTLITPQANGALIEFVGGKANMPMPMMTQTSSTLLATANTITVYQDGTHGSQNGSPGTSVSASNFVYRAASVATAGVAYLDCTSITTGGSLLLQFYKADNTGPYNGSSAPFYGFAPIDTNDSDNVTALQAICDSFATSFGMLAGTIVVATVSPLIYSLTFSGAAYLGSVFNCPIISTQVGPPPGNNTDGTPTITWTTPPTANVSQIDHCIFSGVPDSGSMNFDGQSLAYNVDANTLALDNGGAANGVPSSNLIITTYSDYLSHTPVAADGGSLIFGEQPQIIIIILDDAPDRGGLLINEDGHNGIGNAVAFPMSAADIASTLTNNASSIWTGDSLNTASPYRLICSANTNDALIDVEEDTSTPALLQKAVHAVITVLRIGRALGSRARKLQLLK